MYISVPKHFENHRPDRPLLVSQYEITPLRRFQCLDPVKGLYKQITVIAYQFEAYRRNDLKKQKFSFYVGSTTGDEFLKLTNQSLPPLQTWETVLGTNTNSSNSTPAPGATPGAALGGVAPFNEQLLNVLGLFFLKHHFDPAKPSADMFRTINANPRVPQKFLAKGLNSILMANGDTTLSLIAWLIGKANGKAVRAMEFDLVHAYLLSQGVPVPSIQP
jgi:hypothetical protein